jgi:hypothetical protein
MFNTQEGACEFLRVWFAKMGYTDSVDFSEFNGLWIRNGREAWDIDAAKPQGTFYVFAENGDVQDYSGRFGNPFQMYNREGQMI